MRTTKIAWSKKTKACSAKCCLCGTCGLVGEGPRPLRRPLQEQVGAMTTWTFNGWFGRSTDIELEDGVLDEHATDVFSRGHCHSLALALYELIPDAELIGAWRDGELDHVFIKLRDGRDLDINGLSADGHIEEWMGGDVFTEGLDYEELEWAQASGGRFVRIEARKRRVREGVDRA